MVEWSTKQRRTYDIILAHFKALGYSGGRLRESYTFQDWFDEGLPVRTVRLAAFAQEPVSYDNACLSVVSSNGISGLNLIAETRALGAPYALEIGESRINFWKVAADPTQSVAQERVTPEGLDRLFNDYGPRWRPDEITRLKGLTYEGASQLDFIDLGLVPALEEHIRAKLDPLLRRVLAEATGHFKRRSAQSINSEDLIRLTFWFMAGKIFHDREMRGFRNFDSESDPKEVLSKLAAHYGEVPPNVGDENVRQIVFQRLWSSFDFRNLSVEVLAFIYENTLVTDRSREEDGVHATPPSVARYMIRRLAIEDTPFLERNILEPCCGHGTFLIAGLNRLRELLPPGMTGRDRHSYFRNHLAGFEKDPFGIEVSRLSLMLADFPNPNGWNLKRRDLFTSRDFSTALQDARFVLCNPPFEDFTPEEQTLYRVRAVQKPAEILHRVLDHLHPSGTLAFVLPRVVIDGGTYRTLRERLVQRFDEIEIVNLPESKVFQNASPEATLLIARRVRTTSDGITVRQSEVGRADWTQFRNVHTVSPQRVQSITSMAASDSLAIVTLGEVWAHLEGLQTIGEATVLHRGIEWQAPFDESLYVSDSPKAGYKLGFYKAQNYSPYLSAPTQYLSVRSEHLRRGDLSWHWQKPKVILNAVRKSADQWRLAAFVDAQGLYCTQNFFAIWPIQLTPNVLAAVLNGPVANAFVNTHARGKHNRREIIERIPVPAFDSEQAKKIDDLVAAYTALSRPLDTNSQHKSDMTAAKIDEEVLAAYKLPKSFRTQIGNYFAHTQRPSTPLRALLTVDHSATLWAESDPPLSSIGSATDRLLKAGLISRRPKDPNQYTSQKAAPIQVKGQAVSALIVEERR